MAENILDVLGISEEDFNKAKDSTVTKLVEALESGVYPATVQSAILYKAKFQDSGEVVTTLRVEIKLDESGKVVTFKKDIGKNDDQ
jgi:methyl coenzyme M reductase gamma subunit